MYVTRTQTYSIAVPDKVFCDGLAYAASYATDHNHRTLDYTHRPIVSNHTEM
ncbi:hypothetical protein AGR1C_pTi0166 [Agrobacterium fabacearum TT111]|nr:hypothetical protein AGR1C_pTi0166 [Agrobacterium fabacearum TT111]